MSVNRLKFIIVISAVARLMATAQTPIWSEEFNYTSAPDSDVWSYDRGDWGWGNNEFQNYTDEADNVWVDGSNLVITARRSGNNFTSGRIKSLDKVTFQYGTVEARIQVPNLANGLWPAFWTLGNDFPAVGWPECGEIDIMEMGIGNAIIDGVVNRRVGSHFHWGSLPNHPNWGRSKDMVSAIDGTFVVYRMEWTPTSISTYINGQWIVTMSTSGIPEFNRPHFFLLNLAVGGTYTGIESPDGITTDFPAEYRVDWIRIYDNGHTVLGGSSQKAQTLPGMNALENPGFELGTLAPWTGFASGGANEAGGYVESTNNSYYNGGNPGGDNVLVKTGRYAAKVYGDFTGAENHNGFYQDLPAEPESVWAASCWALTHPQDLMTGANTAWIEVSFRDEADLILSLYRSPLLTSSNLTPGAWMNLTVTEEVNPAAGTVIGSVETMEAPAGTTAVRCQVVFRQANNDGGSLYFDDLSLIEQIRPFPLSASMTGGDIQIRFPTQDKVSYRVVYKESLAHTNWIPLGTFSGDGSTRSLSYPMTNSAGFYSVLTP